MPKRRSARGIRGANGGAKVLPSNVVKENEAILKRGSYTISRSKVALDKARMSTRPITFLGFGLQRETRPDLEIQGPPRVRVLRLDSFDAALLLEQEGSQAREGQEEGSEETPCCKMTTARRSKTRKDTHMTRTCVLDFASDSNPGGGYKSDQQGTQEESLCRRSSLAMSLEVAQYPIPFMGAVLCPEVAVFRDQNLQLLPQVFWVSCIAASLRSQSSSGDGHLNDSERQVVKQKIRLVLEGMQTNGIKRAVLGAWGCGAFGNDPVEIAGCFSEVLRSEIAYGFTEIVFAIPNEQMAVVFERELAELM